MMRGWHAWKVSDGWCLGYRHPEGGPAFQGFIRLADVGPTTGPREVERFFAWAKRRMEETGRKLEIEPPPEDLIDWSTA